MNATVFDMDGLLFDTEGIYKMAWQTAAAEFGVTLDEIRYRELIGKRTVECEARMLDWYGADFPLAVFSARWQELRREEIDRNGVPPKPGAFDLLNWVKTTNLRTALATSSSMEEVRDNFGDRDPFAWFETIITSADVLHGKPDPEIYQLACRRLDVPPADAWVLEDSNLGVRAAVQAGCRTIMVPDLLPPDDFARTHAIVVQDLNAAREPLEG